MKVTTTNTRARQAYYRSKQAAFAGAPKGSDTATAALARYEAHLEILRRAAIWLGGVHTVRAYEAKERAEIAADYAYTHLVATREFESIPVK